MGNLADKPPLPRVLTVAGSDSGGGAGIEADLKVCTALGCYGMAAVTAVTAQNTQSVCGVEELSPGFVAQQIDVVAEDIGLDAVKTGMLSNAAIVEAVAGAIERRQPPYVVVDPVMVAKSGDTLLKREAREALIHRLLPLSTLVTPNMEEAAVLADMPVETDADMRRAAARIHSVGVSHVLVKGGHRLDSDLSEDYLFDGESIQAFSTPRVETKNTHGTGCTFATAIACYLALGQTMHDAIHNAKTYLYGALRHSLALGHGHGPLNHMWRLREDTESE